MKNKPISSSQTIKGRNSLAVLIGSYLKKIRRLLRERGIICTLKFLGGRLLFRRAESAVYEACLREPRQPSKWQKEEQVFMYDPENWTAISDDLVEFLGGESAMEYVEGLAAGDRLFVIRKGNQYLHYGFILFSTRQTRVIGEKEKVPLIANCYTVPDARGHGLYRRALNDELCYLRQQGYTRALIETRPDNHGSRKGIEAAGFRPCREMTIWILFNKIAIQFIKTNSHLRCQIMMV